METIDATIKLNSPMFPCFWEAVLSIAAFQEAALLEAALSGFWEAVLSMAALLEGCVLGRLCF